MTFKLKKYSLILICAATVLACSPNSKPAAEYPARPVNIIVYSSAGGATDLANRAIADGMKETLGVDVITSNMPGALGGTAVNYVWNQNHNGYNMVGISEGMLGHSVLGLHTKTAKDWDYFMVGGTPGILSVNSKSPYTTFSDLYSAVKTAPGKLSIATSVPGSVWNVQWLNTKKLGGFDTKFIPYPGSFPSQTAALSGEVDMVWTGLGEQSEFLKGDRLRPLAVFDNKAIKFEGQTIPPITDFIPELQSVMPINQFVGFALPNDTPEDVKTKITAAFKASIQSDTVKDFSVAKHSVILGLYGQAAKDLALSQEKAMVWTLWDAGIAKKNPADLGISKP